jgi:hypothetical protein
MLLHLNTTCSGLLSLLVVRLSRGADASQSNVSVNM